MHRKAKTVCNKPSYRSDTAIETFAVTLSALNFNHELASLGKATLTKNI